MGSITDICHELRNNPTEAEKEMWSVIRKRKRKDLKFLRQVPLFVSGRQNNYKYFIADFYCAEAKLVIEVDGGYHLLTKELDTNRDEVLASHGLTTLRFTNDEVMKNIGNVVKKIDDFLDTLPRPAARDIPSL